MKPAPAAAPDPTADLVLRRGFDPAALAALFVLSLRQHVRGTRLLVLSLLFLLPSVLAAVVRLGAYSPPPAELEFAFVFTFIPHALAPLAALLYAAGIIQDEVEEQTLTYLLLRPLPRWALYLTKLAATLLVTAVLTAAFTTLTLAVVWWGAPAFWGGVLPLRAAKIAGLLALAQAAYCTLFGALSLITRRSLLTGLAYIVLVEGMLANFEFVARKLTVIYWFRVLSLRWLQPAKTKNWSIDLTTAPSAQDCLLTLLCAAAAFALLGAVLTMRREFHMKTPEGS